MISKLKGWYINATRFPINTIYHFQLNLCYFIVAINIIYNKTLILIIINNHISWQPFSMTFNQNQNHSSSISIIYININYSHCSLMVILWEISHTKQSLLRRMQSNEICDNVNSVVEMNVKVHIFDLNNSYIIIIIWWEE